MHSFVIPTRKGTVKSLGEAEGKAKLLDSVDLLIHSRLPVLTTSDLFTAFPSSPYALFFRILPFYEIMWFILTNLDSVFMFLVAVPQTGSFFCPTINFWHSFHPIFALKIFFLLLQLNFPAAFLLSIPAI